MNELDDHLMQMFLANQVHSQMHDSVKQAKNKEQDDLQKAIQESMQGNPNPDMMNYEQLQELGDKIGTVSKGFTEEEIKQIEEEEFMPDYGEDSKCAICLEEMEKYEMVKKLKCKHTFHVNCINISLESNKKCPFCLSEIDINHLQ